MSRFGLSHCQHPNHLYRILCRALPHSAKSYSGSRVQFHFIFTYISHYWWTICYYKACFNLLLLSGLHWSSLSTFRDIARVWFGFFLEIMFLLIYWKWAKSSRFNISSTKTNVCHCSALKIVFTGIDWLHNASHIMHIKTYAKCVRAIQWNCCKCSCSLVYRFSRFSCISCMKRNRVQCTRWMDSFVLCHAYTERVMCQCVHCVDFFPVVHFDHKLYCLHTKHVAYSSVKLLYARELSIASLIDLFDTPCYWTRSDEITWIHSSHRFNRVKWESIETDNDEINPTWTIQIDK